MQMKNPRVTCSSCIRVIWLRCAKTAASPVCLYFIIIVIMVIMIVCRLAGRGLGSAAGWMEREGSQSPRVASSRSLCVVDNVHRKYAGSSCYIHGLMDFSNITCFCFSCQWQLAKQMTMANRVIVIWYFTVCGESLTGTERPLFFK